MVADQEKPVASPCDIASHDSMAGHMNFYFLCHSAAGHVRHAPLARIVQRRRYSAYRRVNLVVADADFPQVRKRDHQPDRPVNAHPQITDIVEVKYSRRASWVRCFAKYRANRDL